MVDSKDIYRLINLSNEPQKASPADFEWLAKHLDELPDFDLLRKAFVLVGEKFGASGPNFEEERNIWKRKKVFYEPTPKIKKRLEANPVNKNTTSERISQFMKQFQPVLSPY